MVHTTLQRHKRTTMNEIQIVSPLYTSPTTTVTIICLNVEYCKYVFENAESIFIICLKNNVLNIISAHCVRVFLFVLI